MPVKYLSPEWIDAYNATVAADESVRKALKGKSAVIQMVVADAPPAARSATGSASATAPPRRASVTRATPR